MPSYSTGDFRWAYSTALQEGMSIFCEGTVSKIDYVKLERKRSGIQMQVRCEDGRRLFLYPKDRVAVLVESEEKKAPKMPAGKAKDRKSVVPKIATKEQVDAWLLRQLRIYD